MYSNVSGVTYDVIDVVISLAIWQTFACIIYRRNSDM